MGDKVTPPEYKAALYEGLKKHDHAFVKDAYKAVRNAHTESVFSYASAWKKWAEICRVYSSEYVQSVMAEVQAEDALEKL